MSPYKPKTGCKYAGCPTLVEQGKGGYCEEHKKLKPKQPSFEWHHLYNNFRWVKARKVYLNKHPLCEECKRKSKLKAATDIDHIIPHKGNYELFWNTDNWQSLCKECHGEKTGKGE